MTPSAPTDAKGSTGDKKNPRSRPGLLASPTSIAIAGFAIAVAILYSIQPLHTLLRAHFGQPLDSPPSDSPSFLEITSRLRFSSGLSSPNKVYCYPSNGGIWIAAGVSTVELEFLGLDRFTEREKSENQDEEDKFCQRLRKIGAKWWQDYDDYIDAMAGARRMTKEETTELVLAWPKKGGVCVIKIDGQLADGYRWTPGHIDGLGLIQNAYTMEERCEVIRQFGGTFYDSAEDYEDIGDLE